MTPRELHALTADALAIAGSPSWPSIDDAGATDTLAFIDADETDGEPVWGLLPEDAEADYIPLDTNAAASLLQAHLEGWLLDRGWQVQARVTRGRRQWRLVDCLSPSDGGGDRLDGDYPTGDEALDVVCRAVASVGQS